VTINNSPLFALIDTGSAYTLLSSDMARKLDIRCQPLTRDEQPVLFTASGSEMPIVAKATLELGVGDQLIKTHAKVIQNLSHQLIIGCNSLKALNAVIDLGRMSITFQHTGQHVDLLTATRDASADCASFVVSDQCVRLPPYTECDLVVRAPRKFDNRTIIIEPNAKRQFHPFAVARSLSRCQNGRTVCRILNLCPRSMLLFRNQKLGVVQDLSMVASVSPYKQGMEEQDTVPKDSPILLTESKEILEQFASEYKFKVNPELDDLKRQQLLQVLYNNRRGFARRLEEIGTYPHLELALELTSDRRAYKRQYRLSQVDAEECERQIQLLLANDVIEPSDSVMYNSPLFLVDKKDGTKRMVIDLRLINSLVAPMLVVLPRINELLEQATLGAGNERWFSSCDLFSGFYAIRLHRDSRKLTSFTSPLTGERFMFSKIPFGLCNSPAAMCLALNQVLKGVLRTRFLSYVDDLLITSGTWKNHLTDLTDLLTLLIKNNLTCNPSKCEFGFSQIDFLGFNVSKDGIRVSSKKAKIIEKLAPPTSRKSLQRIIGLLSYFRRHVRSFAQKTANMRKLVNSEGTFCWTPECDAELTYLKQRLTSDDVLRPLDPSRDIVIQCDASDDGTGYVVMQQHDSVLYPCMFGGHVLTEQQKKYSSSDKELISLVQSLKAIEWVGLHKSITIFTDCARVLKLNTWHPLNARQRRLIAYCLQFRLDIRYIEGCKNYCADTLSRCFNEMTFDDRALFLPDTKDDSEFVVAVETRKQKVDRQTYAQTMATPPSGLQTADDPTYPQTETPPTDTLVIESDALLLPSPAASPDVQPSDYIDDLALPQPSLTNESDLDMDSQTETQQVEDATDSAMQAVEMQITATDYLHDNEFSPIYTLLTTNQLTGDDKTDKKSLLLADQHFIRGELLYRLKLPRNSKEHVLFAEKLCVPRRFRREILERFHDNLSHFGIRRCYATIACRFHWQSLYLDLEKYISTCDVCQRTKRNYLKRVAPLNTLQVPVRPFSQVQIDHKNLPRPTKEGSVAILCMIDAFTGWPILVGVRDLSAETTAKMLFKHLISQFGAIDVLVSDRGSSFTAKVFSALLSNFAIHHKLSASRAPRTNGLAESLVKRINELCKRLCEQDSDIEQALPMMEMSLRATANTTIGYSPFELLFGRPMPLGRLPETVETIKFDGDYARYLTTLRNELDVMHGAVRKQKIEVKHADEAAYNKRHKTVPPHWSVGQCVLLHDDKVRPRSTVVLTKPPFRGPFYVSEVIHTDPSIGASYRLVDVITGKAHRYLVNGDRLRPYNVDRVDLDTRLPLRKRPVNNDVSADVEKDPASKAQSSDNGGNSPPVDEQEVAGMEPALRIVRERMINGKPQWLVLFADKQCYYCDTVSPALLKLWRLSQERRRAQIRNRNKRRK